MPPDVPALKIEPANAADLPAMAALLQQSDLPHDDVAGHLATFVVARHGNVPVGAIGAELCGGDALLRSLVVAPEYRRAGLGARLLDALERAAAGWGVNQWWLLTMSAERFFTSHGFRAVPRASAPPAIRRTSRFDGHDCGTAVCLTRPRKDAP